MSAHSSQEPMMINNVAYIQVSSLTTEELHPSGVAGSDTSINVAPNPCYKQHNLEYEYAYPNVIPTPGRGVHVASDSDTYEHIM